MKKLILVFLSLILFTNCDNNNDEDNCNGQLCNTPPKSYRFEILDIITLENLFTNDTYSHYQTKITNVSDCSDVEFEFDSPGIIKFLRIGWETEIVNYKITIADEIEFTLFVDATRVQENCCVYTLINEEKIEGIAFEYDASPGIYKILVE